MDQASSGQVPDRAAILPVLRQGQSAGPGAEQGRLGETQGLHGYRDDATCLVEAPLDEAMQHTAILIGLGRIGWRGFLEKPAIETHAGALLRHPDIRLLAAVDTDAKARLDFQTAYGLKVYESLDDALRESVPDIAVVATPPATHRPMVERLALAGVRGILCEKPLSLTVADARACDAVCRNHGTVLAVGHQRRYESRHLMLRAFLNSGVLGKPHAAVGWYSGEALNNGVHAADVLRMMVGDEVPKSLSCSRPDTLRIEIGCERGWVALESYGDLAPGYMRTMYDNLIAAIDRHEHVMCSGDDGVEAVRLALASKELENVA